jgi:hypothetical protein
LKFSFARWPGGRPSRRCVALLAVAAFALQAAVPAGFMLAHVGGHVGYTLCPSAISQPPTPMPGMSAGQMAAMHSHAGGAAPHEHACPFALAGGAALLGRAAAVAEPFYVFLRPLRPAAVSSLPAVPPARYRAPRGPPVLA